MTGPDVTNPADKAQLHRWPRRVCRRPARIGRKQRQHLVRRRWLSSLDPRYQRITRMYLWSEVAGRRAYIQKQRRGAHP